MTTPVPGFLAPNPRTWTKGDIVTTPRLRGDMANLAALFTQARPMLFAGSGIDTFTNGSASLINMTVSYLNTWNVQVLSSSSTNFYYAVPLAGWWLVQGGVTFVPSGGTPTQAKYAMGFNAVVNGVAAANTDGGALPSAGGSLHVSPAGAELYQLNPGTSDTIAWYGFQNSGVNLSGFAYYQLAEWVALPTSGLTSYGGPYGTVVTSPQAAAAWPSGPGTFITNGGGIAAGATSVTVNDATGMITGGTLGLDWINGQQFAPVAEAVTITGVAGTTISISATAYPHLQNAPVAVPVSAAFLNQQVRDEVRFLAYPPLLRAQQAGVQSIPSQIFPTGTQITFGTVTVDNFSGFASSQYTVPVAGTYLVYGQVYLAGSTSAFTASAGITVNGGTTIWGTRFRSNTTGGAQSLCPWVRRLLRFNAGDVVQLFGSQDSGGAMNTVTGGATNSRLIMVWRST